MHSLDAWGLLSEATWEHLLLALGVLLAGYWMANGARSALRRTAERTHPQWRLAILRSIPIVRLGIGVTAISCAVPMLIEPTFRNVVGLLASVGLIFAF